MLEMRLSHRLDCSPGKDEDGEVQGPEGESDEALLDWDSFDRPAWNDAEESSKGFDGPLTEDIDIEESDGFVSDEEQTEGLDEQDDGSIWFDDQMVADDGMVGVDEPDEGAGVEGWEEELDLGDDEEGPVRWGDAGIGLEEDESHAVSTSDSHGEEYLEEHWEPGGAHADVLQLRSADVPWTVVDLRPDTSPMSDLFVDESGVVAVGAPGAVRFGPGELSRGQWYRRPQHVVGGWQAVERSGNPHETAGWWVLATATRVYTASSLQGAVEVGSGLKPRRGVVQSLVSCGVDSGVVLVTTDDGELWASFDGGRRWKPAESRGRVHALAWSERLGAVLLSREHGRWFVARGFDGRTWDSPQPVPDEKIRLSGGRVFIVPWEDTVAFVDESGAMFRTSLKDIGRRLESRSFGGRVTAATMITLDGRSRLVVAKYDESEDRSLIVVVGENEPPVVVGRTSASELAADHHDAEQVTVEILRLKWDPFRNLLWAAGEFGVRAWRPPVPS